MIILADDDDGDEADAIINGWIIIQIMRCTNVRCAYLH